MFLNQICKDYTHKYVKQREDIYPKYIISLIINQIRKSLKIREFATIYPIADFHAQNKPLSASKKVSVKPGLTEKKCNKRKRKSKETFRNTKFLPTKILLFKILIVFLPHENNIT